MPTLIDLQAHLTSVQVTPSVPGVLPPDKVGDPNITYWFGLLSLLAAAAATVSYIFGLKFGRAETTPAGAVASAAAAKAEAQGPHDPSASMYWDAILNSIFEGIKRVEADTLHIEGHILALKSEDSSLREAVLKAAQDARHGVAKHLQDLVVVQERQHDENSRAIVELSRQMTGVSNHISSQIAGLSGQINALAVTVGKVEAHTENMSRRSSR